MDDVDREQGKESGSEGVREMEVEEGMSTGVEEGVMPVMTAKEMWGNHSPRLAPS